MSKWLRPCGCELALSSFLDQTGFSREWWERRWLISLADEAVQRGVARAESLLWIDENHDGVAQAAEIHTFADSGIASIAAGEYRKSDWTDSSGNRFRYAAPVYLTDGRRTRSYDVFLDLGEVKPK